MELSETLQPVKPSEFARLPETGFVRLPTVLMHFPIGRSTWWAGVRSGKYPKPIKLGPKTSAWKAEDIRRMIEEHAGRAVKGVPHTA